MRRSLRHDSGVGAQPPVQFIHWMTPPGSGAHVEPGRRFNEFSDVFRELHPHGRPLRPQTSASNCTLFALWTALEVIKGKLERQPPFMDNKVPKDGQTLRSLHDSSRVQNFLAGLGVKTTPNLARGQIPTGAVVRALERGPVVVGMSVNMFDDEDHVRWKSVKREFLNRAGDPSGNWGNCLIEHSICLVGHVTVDCEHGSGRTQGFYIARDSQSIEEIGERRSGCSLIPDNEVDVSELYVIEPLMYSHSMSSGDDRPKPTSFLKRGLQANEASTASSKRTRKSSESGMSSTDGWVCSFCTFHHNTPTNIHFLSCEMCLRSRVSDDAI